MKILTFKRGGQVSVGVLKDDGAEVVPVEYLGCGTGNMNAFLDEINDTKLEKLAKSKEMVRGIPLEDVEIMAPIPEPRQDVICMGVNYYDHAVEAGKFIDKELADKRPVPIYFSKRAAHIVGDEGMIDGHWDIVEGLDYEVELAVVLGRDAKNVKAENAFDYVFGYSVLNDISARNLQTAHKQWYFGKSLDDHTSMGPYIVTKDEFDKPPAVGIRCYVNDELRQDSNTSNMITGIAQVIEQLSQGMTLKAGTIIAMGTPAGVGMGFDPPKFLKIGDVVRCEIDGIGALTNHIK